MIYSMTGFGKASTTIASKTMSVEIKTLNGKHFDVNMRLPQRYRAQEIHIRKLLAQQIYRGKADLQLNVEEQEGQGGYQINQAAVKDYLHQLAQINTQEVDIKSSDMLNAVMRIPDTLQPNMHNLSSQEENLLNQTLQAAINQLTAYRANEGKALATDLTQQVHHIEQKLQKVAQHIPQRLVETKQRLHRNLKELQASHDANRLEQEMIYYLEKLDINEEIVRLKNHCTYFLKVLNNTQSEHPAKGKKLNFIAQEMGREINTIGSKANYAPMQRQVVNMKDALERIKEQLMNVM